MIICR